jgi:hypothetical protein
MVLIDDELLLIENSKKYLTAFLVNSGTFFPFALIMNNEGIIYPLEPEVVEESIEPTVLIDLYERTFSNEIKKIESEYKLGILCVDIFIHATIDNVNTKKSAIEIKLVGATYQKKVVLFYQITEAREIIFQELVGWD